MKIVCSFLLLGVASAVYTPVRVRYDSLLASSSADGPSLLLLQALQEVGMVSITDISPSFQKQKEQLLLRALPGCLLKDDYEEGAHAAATTAAGTRMTTTTTFPDGTIRRTIASHSLKGVPEVMQFLPTLTEECREFADLSVAFRQTIQEVVQVFTNHLSNVLELDEEQTLLFKKTKQREQVGGDGDTTTESGFTLTETIQQGDHLEHFHVYEKSKTSNKNSQENVSTLDWHVDQGLLLAFTPGVDTMRPQETTGGFYIQFPDGSSDMVQFDAFQDDLVFFLGDGMTQILAASTSTSSKQLRALPHALRMDPARQRVWYGRMVLAPSTAIHPSHPTQTFGDIRTAMIQLAAGSSSSEDQIGNAATILSLGCSSNKIARLLADDGASSCLENSQSFCWHQCMNYTDYDVSPDLCDERQLEFACASAENELWNGTIHNPKYAIRCGSDFKNASDGDDGHHTNGDDNHTTGNGNDDSAAPTTFVTGFVTVGTYFAMTMMMLF